MREKAILFCGTLFHFTEVYRSCLSALKQAFGDVLLESPPLPWDFSEYYRDEMGSPLFRNFIFFATVVDSSVLLETKLKMREIEGVFSANGKRRINLDPGYLTTAKVVLASHKNYSHRIHLGKEIFAELELIYSNGAFHALPYSYRDYRDDRFLELFTEARLKLKCLIERAID